MTTHTDIPRTNFRFAVGQGRSQADIVCAVLDEDGSHLPATEGAATPNAERDSR